MKNKTNILLIILFIINIMVSCGRAEATNYGYELVTLYGVECITNGKSIDCRW